MPRLGGGRTQGPEKRGPKGSDFWEVLVAAAGPHDHVPVFLQDDVGAVVEVEDRDGVELSWSAAGLGHRIWVDKVDLEHTPQCWQLGKAVSHSSLATSFL